MEPRRLAAVFAVTLPIFLYGVYRFSVGVLVPDLEAHFSVGDTTAGAVISGSVGLVGLGVVVSGLLSRRLGDLRVIAAGLAVFSGGMAAIAVLSGMAGFTAIFLLASFGSGLVIPPSYGVAAALLPERKGLAASIVSAGYNFGGFVGPPATSVLLVAYGWGSPFLFFALIGVACLAAVVPTLGGRVPATSGRSLRSFGAMLRMRVVRVLSLAVFFADLGFLVYISWAPKFLSLGFASSVSDATALDAVFGLGLGLGAFGTLAGGVLYDRVGGRKSVIAAGVLPAASLLGTFLAHSFLLTMAFVLLAGILGNIFWPLITAMCQDSVPEEDRTAATSVVQTSGFVGAFIGPGLAGFAGGPVAPVLVLTSALPFVAMTLIGGVFYRDPARPATATNLTGQEG